MEPMVITVTMGTTVKKLSGQRKQFPNVGATK